MLQSVVHVASDASGTPDPVYGSVLQPQITSGTPEGSCVISSYTTINGTYGDGTSYTLQQPNYTFSPHTPAFYSVRLSPQLVGMGLTWSSSCLHTSFRSVNCSYGQRAKINHELFAWASVKPGGTVTGRCGS